MKMSQGYDFLDTLGLAGLLALRAEIDDRLAQLGEVESQDQDLISPNCEGGRPNERKSGRHWVELKRIKGFGPYAYERWFEGGRKRSRYIGKATELTGGECHA